MNWVFITFNIEALDHEISFNWESVLGSVVINTHNATIMLQNVQIDSISNSLSLAFTHSSFHQVWFLRFCKVSLWNSSALFPLSIAWAVPLDAVLVFMGQLAAKLYFAKESVGASTQLSWNGWCVHHASGLSRSDDLHASTSVFAVVKFDKDCIAWACCYLIELPRIVSWFFLTKRKVILTCWNRALQTNRASVWLVHKFSNHFCIFCPEVCSNVVEVSLEVFEVHPEGAIFSCNKVKRLLHRFRP